MRWAMRIFGGLNILASLFSLLYLAWGVEIHLGKWPGNPTGGEWAVFLILCAVSTFLVLYLAYLGVRMFRGESGALKRAIPVFALEIAIVFADFIVTWLIQPKSIPDDILWFWSIAIFPLDPQVYFGYVFFGIVAAFVLLVAGRKSPVDLAAASELDR